MTSALKELVIELGDKPSLPAHWQPKLGKTQPKCSRNSDEGKHIVGEMAWRNFAKGSGLELKSQRAWGRGVPALRRKRGSVGGLAILGCKSLWGLGQGGWKEWRQSKKN